MRHFRLAFASTSITVAVVVACGSSNDSTFPNGGGDVDSGSSGNSSGFFPPVDGALDPNAKGQPIAITPADHVLNYNTADKAPTVQYVAKIAATGMQVPALFAIDRGELGTIDPNSGLFTASGFAGGVARITATWNGSTTSTNLTVKLKATENGGPIVGDAGTDGGGAGGNGGVGGAGPGGPVSDTTAGVLAGAPTSEPNLSMLYPYNDTVWPRGILAPLLMWKPGDHAAYDAVAIRLKEDNFEYVGTFAKNAADFKNHPISQQAWKQLLASNHGEPVTVTLVFEKGGVAYGPLTTTWKIASAPLKGVVYYNSYGTRLAKNYGDGPDEKGALPDNSKFGGATLAIRGGSTDPTLVAGGNGDFSYCRVCHSVSANGATLITQRKTGGKREYSSYELSTLLETPLTPTGGDATNTNKYSWSAISPDGTIFLGDSSSADGSHSTPNQLYQVATGGTPQTPAALPMNGWPAGLRAAFPAFSPDGKNVSFSMFAGIPGADSRTLAYMPFDRATSTFGALKELHRPTDTGHYAMYPAFLPTNDAIVYEVMTRHNGRDHGYGETRADKDTGESSKIGARGELWWVNANGATPVPTRLDKLNGVNLPTGPNEHDHDETLNYEPTVNPVPSGGYAWVVFTSRRLYGNVATLNPYRSDPRFWDISKDPTPKKLWVAAIDLNAAPGTDPSHPAFYLPAQELLAGNMRGYWVVDPCQSDGTSCESGDECCGGFCRPNTSGALVCSNVVPTCAQEFEKCSKSADCCNSPSFTCINGRCAVPTPR